MRDCIDVFNGDADGICALHQLRLRYPEPKANLVTGVKRDQALLAKLHRCRHSHITVLDISLDRNRDELQHLLQSGNTVFFADHHYSGDIPDTPLLDAHIDPAPDICTALIVDRLIGGNFRSWAIVGAYGDNLDNVADALAKAHGFSASERHVLGEIGILLNYNGYGTVEADLHVHPADLFLEVQGYRDPIRFARESSILDRIRQGYARDMAQAESLEPFRLYPDRRVFLLPHTRWARRIVGVFANRLTVQKPGMAHAVLVPNPDGSLQVSVRSPHNAAGQGADCLCRRFATGGGRTAAAGINRLPLQDLESFLSAFSTYGFH